MNIPGIFHKLAVFSEIHAINEKCTYLGHLVHDIGLQLKSGAVCTHIRRLRYGHFTLDHALLRNRWTLRDILLNMRMCRPLVSVDKLLLDANIRQLPSGADVKRITSSSESGAAVQSPNTRSRNIVSLLAGETQTGEDPPLTGDDADQDVEYKTNERTFPSR